MARNSEWVRRNDGLRTDCGLVAGALSSPQQFEYLMEQWAASSHGYLGWFLLRHRLVAGETAVPPAVAAIWADVKSRLLQRLHARWGRGGISFRSLLCEAIHHSCHGWQKRQHYRPGISGLASPIPGNDQELKRGQREDVLNKARERLHRHQLERQAKRNQYYRVFQAWEADPGASHAVLNDRLTREPGASPLDSQNFRQTLGRALDLFGRYLAEETAGLFAETEELSTEKLRQAFEELDLMECYAQRSKHCRVLLQLDDDGW